MSEGLPRHQSFQNFDMMEDEMDWNDDYTVDCFPLGDGITDVLYQDQAGEMEYAPYPIDSTEEEIEDWNELEAELGQSWSVDVAKNLCDQSNKNDSTENGMNEEVGEINTQVTPNNSFSEGESSEVRQLRNQLWKQSLKTSLFQHRLNES
jgi:hypothetical protein